MNGYGLFEVGFGESNDKYVKALDWYDSIKDCFDIKAIYIKHERKIAALPITQGLFNELAKKYWFEMPIEDFNHFMYIKD